MHYIMHVVNAYNTNYEDQVSSSLWMAPATVTEG